MSFDDQPLYGETTRPVLTRLNADGSESAVSMTTPTECKLRAECLVSPRLVVPIVFVPGIMGTRLRVAKGRAPAWFPPEGAWDALKQVLQSLGRDASQRQHLLDPDTTEVDDNGPAHPDSRTAVLMGDAHGETEAERSKWRGWGQLHGDSYAQILGVLEQRLAHVLVDGVNADPHWAGGLVRSQDAARLGAQKPFAALDDEALRRAASVFFPVHAVGYNWLQSNKQSADRLATEIERIVRYYAGRKKVCEKVIVVTHSMGGLVARACVQLPGMQDRILGVVHGVMPALGAPATYKRMRAGFEGAAAVLLGRDAAEATAVVANSPGALELLPTRQYRSRAQDGTARHWLRASHAQLKVEGTSGERSNFLGESDFYTDIYLNNSATAWWRMVKEELIDPAGRDRRKNAKREKKQLAVGNEEKTDFERYAGVLEQVQTFHDHIEDRYHSNTFAYYAADADQRSWNEVHWRSGTRVPDDYMQANTVEDDLSGTVRIRVGELIAGFAIDGPNGIGDGTVPEESGSAPSAHVTQIFRHEGRAKGHTGYDHQHSYSSDIAQATTLYSIVRMIADSKWIADNLNKA